MSSTRTQNPGAEPNTTPQPAARPKTAITRQFSNFYFFKMDTAWRRLPKDERDQGKLEMVAACDAFQENGGILVPYTLMGVRGDCDVMLWRIHTQLEALQEHATDMFRTPFGQYANVPYSLLGMTKRSVYMDRIHPDHEEDRMHVIPGKEKYIFIYPFVKTRKWYTLDQETRQRMMDQHIRLGTTYPSVKLNTTYSFGLDDQEFVVAFESDRPDDFLDLVQEMRETEASSYTERDTPIFTCIRKDDVASMIDTVG